MGPSLGPRGSGALPPLLRRNLHLQIGTWKETWRAGAHSRQQSPALCVVPRHLWGDRGNVVRIVPPLVRLRVEWEVRPFCWILLDSFSVSGLPTES